MHALQYSKTDILAFTPNASTLQHLAVRSCDIQVRAAGAGTVAAGARAEAGVGCAKVTGLQVARLLCCWLRAGAVGGGDLSA
jgi:hypothetical protein